MVNEYNLFIRFLKYEQIYKSYFIHVRNWKRLIANGDPDTYIVDAFTWCETEQGTYFWNNIHKEWRNILFNFRDENKL